VHVDEVMLHGSLVKIIAHGNLQMSRGRNLILSQFQVELVKIVDYEAVQYGLEFLGNLNIASKPLVTCINIFYYQARRCANQEFSAPSNLLLDLNSPV